MDYSDLRMFSRAVTTLDPVDFSPSIKSISSNKVPLFASFASKYESFISMLNITLHSLHFKAKSSSICYMFIVCFTSLAKGYLAPLSGEIIYYTEPNEYFTSS